MATFYANPDEKNEPWLERSAIDGCGFRNWHLMFFCFSGFVCFMVLVFCCVKIRVPRTKQEIEADYMRKKLASKFRERLKLIQNQDMDALDLQKALEIIQEDYKNENKNITVQTTAFAPPADYNIEIGHRSFNYMHAEPQQPVNFAKKLAYIMKIAKPPSTQSFNT